MHKRSGRAYGRTQHAQLESDRGYHHTHSVSQPTTILPPVITTTSPIDETRPSYQHPSSEDNSTTPTHMPLIRTSTSDNAGFRLATLRSAVPFHHSSYELEDTSRQVRYSYSQSRLTFQSEPDSVALSDSDSEDEDDRDDKFRRMA